MCQALYSLFISKVVRLPCIRNYAVMKLLQLFLYCSLDFLSGDLKSLIDDILGQDGFICDDFGWWSRFNKSSNGVNDVDIGHVEIMEFVGTNNQVAPSHGASIEYFVIVVDVGSIP